MDSQLKKLAGLIQQGGVVIFSGAGISVSAGIPAFRGDNGIWRRYPPEVFGVWDSLFDLLNKKDPRALTFVGDIYALLLKARPTVSHFAIAALQKQGFIKGVITQNIDDLHTQAGSTGVVELHGNAFEFVCSACGQKRKRSVDVLKEYADALQKGDVTTARKGIPECQDCGTVMRINIVFFQDTLPADQFYRAEALIRECTTMICVGTSGQVYPAAQLPIAAHDMAKNLVEINIDTVLEQADMRINASADSVFKAVSGHI